MAASIASVATLVALAYGVVVLAAWWLQERLLFLPDLPARSVTATPAALGLAFEPVTLDTEDGERLGGWWVPAPGARLALLHFHGNAGNIGHRLELLEIFHRLGVDVLMIDYRGYGASSGRPSETGTHADARAAWRHLVDQRGIADNRILLHGQSLGGAVAAALAAEVTPAGLVLESTFTSVPALAAEIYPWLPVRWLSRLRFDTRARLRKVACPVLVVHSRDDEIVGFHHAERLCAAAGSRCRLLEIRGDHNGGVYASHAAYAAGLARFLAEVDPGPR